MEHLDAATNVRRYNHDASCSYSARRPEACMPAAVGTALIAAAVAAVGWVVTHLLALRAERRRQVQVARLAYVERQLEQLYGPLAFLVLEGRGSFHDLLQTLGRTFVFQGQQPLPEKELALWLFWVDYDLMPRNAAMQLLLASKAHLIDNEVVPASYTRFIEHYNAWRVSHLRWKEKQVPYPWHSKTNYPTEFDRDVLDTFARLKREHAVLVGQLGGSA